MTKNRLISRYILCVLILGWGYVLAKPKYPFSTEWFITISFSLLFGLIGIILQRSVQDYFAKKAGDVSLTVQATTFMHLFRSVDVIGLLCFPIFGVGWGNPTNSPKALTGSKTGQRIWILLSGSISNLLLAIILQFLIFPLESFALPFAGYIALFSKINIYLFFISIFPIPPLNGWLIWKAIRKERVKIDKESFFGEIILVISMITYILPWIIESLSRGFMYWI
ncbi:MAG TPA: hypothetical protein PLE09_00645 [Caldisericia bacterium]|nr:hypothetical protein [Caldisericia bacterium]HXK51046.1 hypothetical protein [Caldisericia bacterium]